MKCPICDFISTDLETHSKFHVEMDFLADNETLPKKKDDSRREIPIIVVLCLWSYGKDNLPLQRSYVL